MRIQLSFKENKMNEVRTMMGLAEFRSYQDLFSNALSLTKWAIRETAEGRAVGSICNSTGRVKELVMPFLTTVADKAPKPEAESQLGATAKASFAD